MIIPVAMTFSRDERLHQPDLVSVTVPRGTTADQAIELRDALHVLWPARDIRVFEAPNLQQARLA